MDAASVIGQSQAANYREFGDLPKRGAVAPLDVPDAGSGAGSGAGHPTGGRNMAEEEKAPDTIDSESLIQVSPEFAEVVSAIASSRRKKAQEPDVEGHAMNVEQFSADGSLTSVICGVIYADS
jgi:hypothetical protein